LSFPHFCELPDLVESCLSKSNVNDRSRFVIICTGQIVVVDGYYTIIVGILIYFQ
jgi:hypothetical protein